MVGRSSPNALSSLSPSRLQHGRYNIGPQLGEGGMAVVYEATDLTTGRRVALKRLRSGTGPRQAAIAALFEREFLALAELKHPRIVEAYDYHIDEEGPFYTMELLEGGDLQRVAPVDYRTACSLAYDVCSALALVHSRRMVFRDLSPNNIRRTKAGFAKLIDFGALAPMGPSRELVGTLPCAAPEAVGFAPLDARTDLYALGATLYFALVRRHAYPGRSVEELVETWRRPLLKPSELVGGIPAELDKLVLDLLQPDPDRRPASAGEVMERLSAIAGLGHDEHLLVKQAYLATPALVGRNGVLDLVRDHASQAKRGSGASISVQGPPRIGRSRMLDAGCLEATRTGMVVLRASASDAQAGEYGVVRALARGLLTQVPRLARKMAESHADKLGRVIPELRAAEEPLAAEVALDAQSLHREVQPLLRQWFCDISESCPLVIAIDDLERVDAPSAAFVALMSREAKRHRVLLLTAQTSDGALASPLQGALYVHGRFSTSVRLEPLNLELSERLLASVFGEVPNLTLLTHHVHRLTRGNPGDILTIAEHLVRENTIQYQAGSWSLPASLSASDLPSSMTSALTQRLERLSADARLLCYALASEPRLSFSFEECAELLPETPSAALLQCLHSLTSAGFIELHDGLYSAAQIARSAELHSLIPEQAQRALHHHLSQLCARRKDMFRTAQHLLRAGEEDEGLRVLVEFAIASTQETDANPDAFAKTLRTLPDQWIRTFDEGLELCERKQRPARDTRALLTRLSGLSFQLGINSGTYSRVRRLFDDVAFDVGLDLFAQVPEGTDPRAAFMQVMASATARYQARDEAQRVADPMRTLGEVPKVMTVVLAIIAFDSRYEEWLTVPSIAPLAPASPAFELMDRLALGLGQRIGGLTDAALETYAQVLRRIEQPDRAGLPPSHQRLTQIRVLAGVALLEAAGGLKRCLEHLPAIRAEPSYETSALLAEQMHHLFQGDLRAARRTKQRLELLRLESNALVSSDMQHLFLELVGHALAQDMTGTRRCVDAIARYEDVHPRYRAACAYGRSEYSRMRGDAPRALAEAEEALRHMRPGEHALWVYAAAAHVRSLVEVGDISRAVTVGRDYLNSAERLGATRNQLRAALALALLHARDLEAARDLAELGLEELLARGCSGTNLATVCEVRAQIAAAMGDTEGYQRYAALFAAQWPGGKRGLRGAGMTEPGPDQPDDEADEEEALAQLKSTWETCHSVFERVHAGLEVMASHMGAVGGVLFARLEGGLVRTAACGSSTKDTDLDVWATDYFAREVTHYETEAVEAATSNAPPALVKHPSVANDQTLTEYAPVLLGHTDPEGYALTGLVVLVSPSAQRTRQPTAVASELSRCVSQMESIAPIKTNFDD